jgi:hypothetical protein
MLPAVFEPAVPVKERPQSYVLGLFSPSHERVCVAAERIARVCERLVIMGVFPLSSVSETEAIQTLSLVPAVWIAQLAKSCRVLCRFYKRVLFVADVLLFVALRSRSWKTAPKPLGHRG